MQIHSRIAPALAGAAALLLAACAELHPSLAQLQWKDGWGDRGAQVLARDHALCARLVEQRRSQLAGCLAARGWTL